MAKNSIRDYSATNSSNTDIQSIDISEGCSPAGINNAIREVMADLKDVSTGAVALESPAFDSASLTGDLTFGDNNSAIFGAGSDLQIYHDGSNSIINDAGTGSLKFQYGGTDGVVFTSGNVAIGGTDASYGKLSVRGGYVYVNEDNTNTNQIYIRSDFGGDPTIQVATSHALKFATSNQERMRIDSSGNVMIGTTSSSVPFYVYNTGFTGGQGTANTYTVAQVQTSTNTSGLWFGGMSTETTAVIGTTTGSGNLAFQTYNGSSWGERMRLDSSGNVGIGTSSPSQKLTLQNGVFQITGSASFLGNVEIGRVGGDNNMGFATGGTERMRITTTGELLVGTTSDTMPAAAAAGQGIMAGTRAFIATETGGDTILGGTTGSNFTAIYQGGAERMRIDSSGNLLVGKTAGSNTTKGSTLTPSGEIVSTITTAGGASQNVFLNRQDADGTAILFRRANSTVGSISVTGSSTSYNTSSDYRLKTAVNYDWDATTRLKQLRPARFEWIADGDDAVPVDGFLAHEVQDIVPESISGTKDAMMDEEYQVSAATGDIYTPAIEAVLDEDGNEVTPAVAEVIHSTDVERPEELAEGQQWRETTAAVMGTRSVPDYQGIDQSKLVPLLVKTIQELEARITALEAN